MMKLEKRDYMKIAAVAAASLAALGLIAWGIRSNSMQKTSVMKTDRAPSEKDPVEQLRALLKNPKATQQEIVHAFAMADNLCQKKRDFEALERISRETIDSKRLTGDFLVLVHFSRYSSFCFRNQFEPALKELYRILPMNLSPDARGAMIGEVARCKMHLDGLPAALDYLNRFMKSPNCKPEMLPYLYNMYATLLWQKGHQDDALRKLYEGSCNAAVPEAKRESFLNAIGIWLSRRDNPAGDLKKLFPSANFRSEYLILNAGAEALLREKHYAKAEKILTGLAKDPRLDQNLRRIAEIKLEICREGMKRK